MKTCPPQQASLPVLIALLFPIFLKTMFWKLWPFLLIETEYSPISFFIWFADNTLFQMLFGLIPSVNLAVKNFSAWEAVEKNCL